MEEVKSNGCEHGVQSQDNNQSSEQNDKEQQKCSICFKQFESHLLLDGHYKICKQTLLCKVCNKCSDNVDDFEKHSKMCKCMFRCDVCGKKFDDISKCSKQVETCTGKLKCTNCEKTFGHWKLLVEHNEQLHEK